MNLLGLLLVMDEDTRDRPPRFCYWVSRTYLGYRQRDEGRVAVDENLIAFWYRAPWRVCSRLCRHWRRVEAAAKTDYGDLGSGRPGTGAPTHSDFLSSINPMLSGMGLKKRPTLWYTDDTSWRCLSGATDSRLPREILTEAKHAESFN